MAPGPLAQRENEAVHDPHEGEGDDAEQREPVERTPSEVVTVGHAVVDERDEPHDDVDYRVDEHEAELAVDAAALLSELLVASGRGAAVWPGHVGSIGAAGVEGLRLRGLDGAGHSADLGWRNEMSQVGGVGALDGVGAGGIVSALLRGER